MDGERKGWAIPTDDEMQAMTYDERLTLRNDIKAHMAKAEVMRLGFKAGTFTPNAVHGDVDTFLVRNSAFMRRCQAALSTLNALIRDTNVEMIPVFAKSTLNTLIGAVGAFLAENSDEHFANLEAAYQPFIPNLEVSA